MIQFKKSMIILMFMILVSCGKEQKDQASQASPFVFVKTTEAKLIDIERLHEIPAVLLAKSRSDLSFQLSGSINEVNVKIGDDVVKGQAMMSLYNPNLDPNLASNLARKESVKAQIEQVKRDVANFKELRKKNSASQNALEQKETEYKDLLAQDKLIQAQIDQARANQSESVIWAPFDGTVTMLDKQVGEFIQTGQVVLTLVDDRSLEVEVNIAYVLWKNLSIGDSVSGRYRDQELTFKVIELAKAANKQSHLMTVIFELQTELQTAIGQSVTLLLPETFEKVYELPLEVVIDDGVNQPYVFSMLDGKAVKNPIKPLYINGDNIIFSSPVSIAGKVVIKGQSKISSATRLKEIQ